MKCPSCNYDDTKNLAPREIEMLGLLFDGHSMNTTAELMFLSPKTVGTYWLRIRRKLQVDTPISAYRLFMIKQSSASNNAEYRSVIEEMLNPDVGVFNEVNHE